jgi:hypothetical protein
VTELAFAFVHLHCNRLFGLDAERERMALELLLRARESLAHGPDGE